MGSLYPFTSGFDSFFSYLSVLSLSLLSLLLIMSEWMSVVKTRIEESSFVSVSAENVSGE